MNRIFSQVLSSDMSTVTSLDPLDCDKDEAINYTIARVDSKLAAFAEI
jgi:hypothetical protein